MWEETGSRFHNCLIQLYCEKVQSLMKDYLLSLPTGISAHPKQVAADLSDQTELSACVWDGETGPVVLQVDGKSFRGARDTE